jgi:hypothetical protein
MVEIMKKLLKFWPLAEILAAKISTRMQQNQTSLICLSERWGVDERKQFVVDVSI